MKHAVVGRGTTTVEDLLKGSGKNYELPCELLTHLMHGLATCGFTGGPRVGKTTMLLATMKEIYPKLTLRVSDCAYEVDVISEMYSERNIVQVNDEGPVVETCIQDYIAKPDNVVHITVAYSDVLAANMIKYNILSAKATLFELSAHSTEILLKKLTTSLCNTTMNSEKDAEGLVLNFLDCDIHMVITNDGTQYIDRVTEVVSEDNSVENSYELHDIVCYNTVTQTYEVKHSLSERLKQKLLSNMNVEDAEKFKAFLAKNFVD